MRNLLKKWINILLFLAGLGLLLFALSFVFIPKDNGEESGIHEPRIYGFLAEPENSLDVLILGDSLSECAIAPRDLWQCSGITSYNCGTGNQTLPQSLEYLQTFFQNQMPKAVVLEANCIYLDCPRTDILTQQAECLFPVIRYHDLWKILNPADYFRPADYTHLEANKGFHPSAEIQPPSEYDLEHYMKPSDKVAGIPKGNDKFLCQIRDYCRDKGAQLLLVSVPSVTNWNSKRHNGITQLAEELEIPYLDLNLAQEELSIDWEQDTMDEGNHLNSAGAQKVSRWLGDYLQSTGLFLDNRSNPYFSTWEQ